MIQAGEFLNIAKENGIAFFTGVPDSSFKEFCSYLCDHERADRHIINANEGSAVALAAGHYLASGSLALVYMQNAGLGNAVNPLLSLADPDVYGIPMILMIGWRGEPGSKDEPQHIKDGRIMTALLETMEIPYEVLGSSADDARSSLARLCRIARDGMRPCALVVRPGTFERYVPSTTPPAFRGLSREKSIEIIAKMLTADDVVVSTTGKISRELFETRDRLGQGHANDFLTIGSMGHCSQIALGVAMPIPAKQVYCIDGDGSLIMHMGTMAMLGTIAPRNYVHIVLNNGAHDSVGGQPTVGCAIDFVGIAKACGYPQAVRIDTATALNDFLRKIQLGQGPVFIEVRVDKGARDDLGRPTISPLQNRLNFMNNIGR